MSELFDPFRGTVATTSSVSADVSMKSVLEAVREMQKLIPPPPTATQRRWAKFLGFPDYPGFMVGQRAWEMLRQEFGGSEADAFAGLFGVAVSVNPELPPNDVLSAEDVWNAMEQNTRDLWLKFFAVEILMANPPPREGPIAFWPTWE